MGIFYTFTCDCCGYTADVQGGRDAGENVEMQTMICRRCRKVVDVPIHWFGSNEPVRPQCSKCEGTDLAAWPPRHPCPRCKGRMIKGEMATIWD